MKFVKQFKRLVALFVCQGLVVGPFGSAYAQGVPGTLKWQFAGCSLPAVVGATAYVGGLRNLYAINVATGQQIWESTAAAGSDVIPVVKNGIIYVGGYGHVYAIDTMTGQQIWNFTTRSSVLSPVVVDGLVYVTEIGGDGTTYALYASTGQPIWNFTTGCQNYCSHAVVNGVLYVEGDVGGGFNDRVLYGLNAVTGQQLWNFTVTNGQTTSPSTIVTGNGVIFAGAVGGTALYALNSVTGKEIWNFVGGNGPPAVVNGVVYVCGGAYGAPVYAIDATTGRQIWVSTFPATCSLQPVVVNSVAYVFSELDGGVVAFNAKTGKTIWNFLLGGGYSSFSLLVADGVVYFTSYCDGNGEEGPLYAINAYTGQPIWNGTYSGALTVVDGMLFVANVYCTLSALYTNVPSPTASPTAAPTPAPTSTPVSTPAAQAVAFIGGITALVGVGAFAAKSLWDRFRGARSTAGSGELETLVN